MNRMQSISWAALFLLVGMLVVRGHASAQVSQEGEPSENAQTSTHAHSEAETEAEAPSEGSGSPTVAPSLATVCDGRGVVRITIEGNERTVPEDVLGAVRLRVGDVCHDTAVSRDARAVWDLGEFSDLSVDAEASGEGVALVFHVVERAALHEVIFEGNRSVSKSDLDEKVTLQLGSPVNQGELREQITKIRDLYGEKGHYLARIRSETRTLENNQIDIVFVIDEGPQVRVRSVRFVGNQAIPESELRDFIQTHETQFFSFISNDDKFNESKFEEDMTRLQVVYWDRGYMRASIGTPLLQLSRDRQYIDITIPITEGDRYRVGTVQVIEVDDDGEEVEPLGGREQIARLIDVRAGDWCSRSAVARNFFTVRRLYRNQGYARADLQPEWNPDPATLLASLTIKIRRGPLVRVERVNIGGNRKTRDLVIRREFPLAEGELFNDDLLEEGRARVTQLGYFDRVDIAEEEGTAPDRIVINIDVVERNTGSFQLGAGFSTIESIIVTAQVQWQNFQGLGQTLNFNLQASGLRLQGQFRYVEPYLFDTQWSMAVDAFVIRRQLLNFIRDSRGGAIAVGHPLLDRRLQLGLRLNIENVDVIDNGGGSSLLGVDQGINVGVRLPFANIIRAGWTNTLTASLTWDDRDNRLFPTSGTYASWSTEFADEALASQNTYIRHNAFFRFYVPLFGTSGAFTAIVFKGNTEFGLITSRLPQGVPIFERFFLGGIFDVRGYPFRQLGPRAATPVAVDPTAEPGAYGEAFGGNMRLTQSFEVEFPLIPSAQLRGVGFFDIGNVWNLEGNLCQAPGPAVRDQSASPCGFDLTRVRASFGFGVRWVSPLGPLRFEWGLPINPVRPFERDIDFQFTIGNSF